MSTASCSDLEGLQREREREREREKDEIQSLNPGAVLRVFIFSSLDKTDFRQAAPDVLLGPHRIINLSAEL